MTDRAGLFWEDLLAGPDALDRFLDAWDEPSGPASLLPDLRDRRLRFIGLGSSRFAALVAATELAATSRSVRVDWASSPAGAPDPDEVLLAISSSGSTPEVVKAARAHRSGGGTVVALTNLAGSPLADAATATIPLQAGEERSGIACRTFRATVAGLALATGLATPDELRDRLPELRRLLDDRAWLRPATELLDGSESVDVIGDGRAIGALEEGALMLREAPRLRAVAWDAGDWLHTAVYTALPGHRAIVVGPTAYDDEIVRTVRRRGGDVLVMDAGGPLDAAFDAVPRIEMLAAQLWEQVTATG